MAHGLIITADGYDETQVEYIYHRLREDAILTSVVTPSGGTVDGGRGSTWHETVSVDRLNGGDAYDFVIIPGGSAPEQLRSTETAVTWLCDFERMEGIIGVIGNGIQMLANIDAIDERMVTGPSELAVNIENAGATYTGEEVAVDGSLVTARGTSALPFFVSATISNSLIPQDPVGGGGAGERPHWEARE
jgi:protease I